MPDAVLGTGDTARQAKALALGEVTLRRLTLTIHKIIKTILESET